MATQSPHLFTKSDDGKTVNVPDGVSFGILGYSELYTKAAFHVGQYGTPLVDTTVLDNILVSFNSSTGTNKTSADTSSMVLFIGNRNTADTIHAKMQGVLSSMIIAYDVFDAYAGQFHIAIRDDMATHAGNANLVGLACKASIKNGKTATGNVSALYVVGGDTDAGELTGDVATGSFDLIRIENSATQVDSAIAFGDPTNMAFLLSMGVAGCVSTSSGAVPNATHKIKVNMGGATGYIHVGAS